MAACCILCTWVCLAEANMNKNRDAKLDLTTPIGRTSNEFQEFQESPPVMEATEMYEDVCCRHFLDGHRSSYAAVSTEDALLTKQVTEANEDMCCKHYLTEHRSNYTAASSETDEEPEDQPGAEGTQRWIIGDTAMIEDSYTQNGHAEFSKRVYVTYDPEPSACAGMIGGFEDTKCEQAMHERPYSKVRYPLWYCTTNSPLVRVDVGSGTGCTFGSLMPAENVTQPPHRVSSFETQAVNIGLAQPLEVKDCGAMVTSRQPCEHEVYNEADLLAWAKYRGHYGSHTCADYDQDLRGHSNQMTAEKPEGTWDAAQIDIESACIASRLRSTHRWYEPVLRNQSRVGCWYGPQSDPRTGNRLKSNPSQQVCLQDICWNGCWYGPHPTQRTGNRLKSESGLPYQNEHWYRIKSALWFSVGALCLISRGMDPTSRLLCITYISVVLMHATSQHALHALYIVVVSDALTAIMLRIILAICMQLSGHKSSMLSIGGMYSVLGKADIALVGIGACLSFIACATQSIYFQHQQWPEYAEAILIGWGGALVWTTLAPAPMFRTILGLGWTAVGAAGWTTRHRKRRRLQGPKAWAEVPRRRVCVGRIREGQDPDILTAYICCTKVIGSQVHTICIFRRKRVCTSTPCKSGPGGRSGGSDSGAYGHRAVHPPGGKMRTLFIGGIGYSVHAALLGLAAPGGGGVTRARLLCTCVCFLGPTVAYAPAVGPPDRDGRFEGERVFKDGCYWKCLLGQTVALGVGVASLFWVQEDGAAPGTMAPLGKVERAKEDQFQAQLSSKYEEDREGRVAAAASSSHEQADASWKGYKHTQGYRSKSKDASEWQDKGKGKSKDKSKSKGSTRRQDNNAWWQGKGAGWNSDSGSGWNHNAQQQDWTRDNGQESSDYGANRGRWPGGYDSGYSGAKARNNSRNKSFIPANPAKDSHLAKQLTEHIDKGNAGRLKIDLVISTDGQFKSNTSDKQDTPTGSPKSPKAVSFCGDTPEKDNATDKGTGSMAAASAAESPSPHHFGGETADVRVKMATAEAKAKASNLTSDQRYNISKYNNDCLPILQGEHYMDDDANIHPPAVEEQDAVPYILEPRPIDHKDGTTEDKRVAPSIIEEAMWSEQYDEAPFIACEQFPICRAMTTLKKIEQRYGEKTQDVSKLWCFGCNSLMANKLKEHLKRNGSSRALPIRAPTEVVKAAGLAYTAGREMIKAKARSNRAEQVLAEKGVEPDILSGMKSSLMNATSDKLRKHLAISLQPEIDSAVQIADNASLAAETFTRCETAYKLALAQEKAIRASTPTVTLGPYSGERWDITKLSAERCRLTKSLQKISAETTEHEKSLVVLGKQHIEDTELLRMCNKCLTDLIPTEVETVDNDVTDQDFPRVPRDEAEYNKFALEIHTRLESQDTVDQADARRQYLEFTIKKMASRPKVVITSQDDDMGVSDNPAAPPPGAPRSVAAPGARDAWADIGQEEGSDHFTDQAAGHGAAADHAGARNPSPTGRPVKMQPVIPVHLPTWAGDEACTAVHEAHLLCDKCPPQLIQDAVDEARRRKTKGLPVFETSHDQGCPCKVCEILSATPPASATAAPSHIPEIRSISTPPPGSPKPRGRSASATRTHEESVAEEKEQELKKQRTELEQGDSL